MSNPEQILTALDEDQREVALALRGPVCVLAGAGTGKTRAITHRIAYGVASGMYHPTSVLALTFTARAAGEMRSRLRMLGVAGVQARTFHAAALRQVQYFYPRAVGAAYRNCWNIRRNWWHMQLRCSTWMWIARHCAILRPR